MFESTYSYEILFSSINFVKSPNINTLDKELTAKCLQLKMFTVRNTRLKRFKLTPGAMGMTHEVVLKNYE